MSCNCKGQRRPLGSKKEPTAPGDAKKPVGSAKSAGGRQTFTLRTDTGKTLTFGSRLDAEAALVRKFGGRGSIRVS